MPWGLLIYTGAKKKRDNSSTSVESRPSSPRGRGGAPSPLDPPIPDNICSEKDAQKQTTCPPPKGFPAYENVFKLYKIEVPTY